MRESGGRAVGFGCWRYHEVPVILLLDSFDSDKLQQVAGRGNDDDLLTTKSLLLH